MNTVEQSLLNNVLREDKAFSDKTFQLPIDIDSQWVYYCVKTVHELYPSQDEASQNKEKERKQYAKLCYQLFPLLRRNGVVFATLVLKEQAKASAPQIIEISASPKMLFYAHFIACLASDIHDLKPEVNIAGMFKEEKLRNDFNLANTLDDISDQILPPNTISLEMACYLGYRAISISEWFKRYAASVLKITQQSANL